MREDLERLHETLELIAEEAHRGTYVGWDQEEIAVQRDRAHLQESMLAIAGHVDGAISEIAGLMLLAARGEDA